MGDLLFERTSHFSGAKNNDVDDLNIKIQCQSSRQMDSFKVIGFIIDPNEVVNHPTKFLSSLDLSELLHTIYTSRSARKQSYFEIKISRNYITRIPPIPSDFLFVFMHNNN